MNKTTRIVLLAVAALLIIGGIGGIVYCIFFGGSSSENEKTEGTTAVIHDDIERFYDDEGNLKSEVYYKDNVYNGQTDYYKGQRAYYSTTFDKDNNEIASTVTETNAAGSITKITSYEGGTLVELVEYDYYEDLRTVAKKTVKTYEGEDEHAEKIYFAEAGYKTHVITFLNGNIVTETLYDENGNVTKSGGDNVEE